uniref:HTH_8 domain-containing protein n=1 Tax=Strongyloides papillosus TaxID=174720 RepID=A0A0N5BAB4_STREA
MYQTNDMDSTNNLSDNAENISNLPLSESALSLPNDSYPLEASEGDIFFKTSQEEPDDIENVSNLSLSEDSMPLIDDVYSIEPSGEKYEFLSTSQEESSHSRNISDLLSSGSVTPLPDSPHSPQLCDIVIEAIELGIRSSEKNEVKVEAVQNFLGISRLELARCLFRLKDRYSLINRLTTIVRK